MEQRRITIVDRLPVCGPGWVYVWLCPAGVMYVGATSLDPAVRIAIHLDEATNDPRSAALRSLTAQAQHGPTVLAFAVGPGQDRQQLKRCLTIACQAAGVLAASFVASGPMDFAEAIEPRDYQAWTAEALTAVQESLR